MNVALKHSYVYAIHDRRDRFGIPKDQEIWKSSPILQDGGVFPTWTRWDSTDSSAWSSNEYQFSACNYVFPNFDLIWSNCTGLLGRVIHTNVIPKHFNARVNSCSTRTGPFNYNVEKQIPVRK